jgi:hypothetical protein
MLVLTGKTKCMEVGAMMVYSLNLGAERLHTEVVTPNLAVSGISEDLGFKGGFIIDT